MNKKTELFNNTVILGVGKASSMLIALILLPLYTRYLSPGEFGIVDLVITYVALLVPVITMQLEMSVFRFLIDSRDNPSQVSQVISNVIHINMIAIAIFILSTIIINSFVVIPFFLYIMVYVIATIINSQLLQMSRGLGMNKQFAIVSVINSVVTLLLTLVLVVSLKMGVIGILLSLIVSSLICSLYIGIKTRIFSYVNLGNLNIFTKKMLLKYSLPLIPNGLALWVISVADRTIILIMLGVYANGIYAISNRFSAIFLSIFGIFWMSWTELVSIHIGSDDRDSFLSDTFSTALSLFGALGLIIISSVPFIFPILISSKFNEALNYIPILIISALISSVVSLYGSIYVAKKATGQLAAASMFAAFISILFSIILLPILGLYAVSIATGISYMLVAINRYFDVKKYVNLSYKIREYFYLFIAYVTVLLAYYTNIFALNIASLIFVIIFSSIANKGLLKHMILKLKSVSYGLLKISPKGSV